ncbi:MAG: hypothetical protein HGB11_06675 [Chlorobiales bacterium]|nr:hypothetical protein [Chlorobiales bacterium]
MKKIPHGHFYPAETGIESQINGVYPRLNRQNCPNALGIAGVKRQSLFISV